MIKYRFTGHLSPWPECIKRAMCGLSGDVYLASDVDALIHAHVNELTRLNATISSLQSKNRGLEGQLKVAKKSLRLGAVRKAGAALRR